MAVHVLPPPPPRLSHLGPTTSPVCVSVCVCVQAGEWAGPGVGETNAHKLFQHVFPPCSGTSIVSALGGPRGSGMRCGREKGAVSGAGALIHLLRPPYPGVGAARLGPGVI